MNRGGSIKKYASFLLIIFIVVIVKGEDIDGNFMHDGLMRSYVLHIPPQYNEHDSMPLVIAMHGGFGTSENMAQMSRLNEKADTASEGSFIVVYPQGLGIIPTWNGGTCCGYAMNNDIDDVGFISALIDTLAANYAVDTRGVYATGMSNGGIMSHRLACESADKIAAIAPVAGVLMIEDWDACQPPRLISIMHIHARDDSIEPYYGGVGDGQSGVFFAEVDSVMEGWARRLECSIGPDTFYNDSGALRQTWTRSDDSCEVVLWTTEDGGHSWPGGVKLRPNADEPSKAIFANDEMWTFFLAHPMPIEEEPEPGVKEGTEPSFPLDTAYPDPVTATTTIRFSLASQEKVSLRLFDVIGREVCLLVEETLSSGEHQVILDTENLPSGVYFYRLETPTLTQTQSITLVK